MIDFSTFEASNWMFTFACITMVFVVGIDSLILLSKKKMLDRLDQRLEGLERQVDAGLIWAQRIADNTNTDGHDD